MVGLCSQKVISGFRNLAKARSWARLLPGPKSATLACRGRLGCDPGPGLGPERISDRRPVYLKASLVLSRDL